MLRLRIGEQGPVKLRIVESSVHGLRIGGPVYGSSTYSGGYEVTPTESAQLLETGGLMMDRDLTVLPIPSNYGRISWNGSTLSVY